MDTQNLQPKFNGHRIAHKRRQKKITQEELGKAIGLTRYQVLRIEKGLSGSLDSLTAICHELDIPMQEVFAPDPALIG